MGLGAQKYEKKMRHTVRIGYGNRSRPWPSPCVPRIKRSVNVSADQLLAIRVPRNGTERFAGQETSVGRLRPKVPQHHKAGLESHQQLQDNPRK